MNTNEIHFSFHFDVALQAWIGTLTCSHCSLHHRNHISFIIKPINYSSDEHHRCEYFSFHFMTFLSLFVCGPINNALLLTCVSAFKLILQLSDAFYRLTKKIISFSSLRSPSAINRSPTVWWIKITYNFHFYSTTLCTKGDALTKHFSRKTFLYC